MGWLLILTSLVALLLGMLVGQGMESLIIITAGCVLFNFGLNTFLWKMGRRFLAYKFFAVWFIYQPVFLFLLLVIFPGDMTDQIASVLPQEGRYVNLFVTFCIVPLLAVLLAKVTDTGEVRNYVGQRIKPTESSFRLPKLGPEFEMMLVISAFISVSIWVATLSNINMGFFFLRVLYRGLFFMPFVAGLYWSRSRFVQVVWIGSLLVNMELASLTGNRSYGFMPLGLYGLGFIVQQATRSKRIFWTTAGILGIVPLLLLAGIIQVLRDQIGRSSLDSIDTTAFMQNIGSAASESLQSHESWDGSQSSALWYGLNRMVDWTMVAAPNMSPDVVPYRGYDDLPVELAAMFSVPALGILPEWQYDSRSLATLYGFFVSEETDDSGRVYFGTSVPFNIVADSWSRGGIVSLVAQVSLALFILLGIERILCHYFMAKHVGIFVLGRTVLIGLAVNFLTGTILSETVRQCIYTLTFTLLAIGLPATFFKKAGTGLLPRAAPPPGGRGGMRPPPPGLPGPRQQRPFRA